MILYCSHFFRSVSTNIQSDECVCQCISFMSFICEILEIITIFFLLAYLWAYHVSFVCVCGVFEHHTKANTSLCRHFAFELYVGDRRYIYDSRVEIMRNIANCHMTTEINRPNGIKQQQKNVYNTINRTFFCHILAAIETNVIRTILSYLVSILSVLSCM